MTTQLKETSIPEMVMHLVNERHDLTFAQTTANVPRYYCGLFHGVSKALGSMIRETNDTSLPKAIVFKTAYGEFILGAKVEYVTNEDCPTDPSAGQWNYSWSFHEEDLNGAVITDFCEGSQLAKNIQQSVKSSTTLFNIHYVDDSDYVGFAAIAMLEVLKKWLIENAKEGEPTSVELEGFFVATSAVEDGKIELGLVPAAEMKVLIKNDSAIQEK